MRTNWIKRVQMSVSHVLVPKQAVRGDAMRLRATNNAFAIGWINPPYDHDRAAKGNKRVEFTMLRHAWKWIQTGGIVMWCVYKSHVTEDAMAFFAQYAADANIWALPGKHQGEYDQIVLVATVGQGKSAHEMQTYNKLVKQKQDPIELTVTRSHLQTAATQRQALLFCAR